MDSISKLASIGTEALGGRPPRLNEEDGQLAGPFATAILDLLRSKNGFFAFESALLVFPAGDPGDQLGLESWNSAELWRDTYGPLAQNCLFFAADAVGGQFCVSGKSIFHFDPETGDKKRVASSLESWADLILRDHRNQTMWPLAHEWQQSHRALGRSERLVPKIPFVLGGEFVSANLYAADAVKAMRFYGDLASQLHDLPDGAQVQLKVIS